LRRCAVTSRGSPTSSTAGDEAPTSSIQLYGETDDSGFDGVYDVGVVTAAPPAVDRLAS
jgi:hypothetical protein